MDILSKIQIYQDLIEDTDHSYNFWINSLCEDAPACSDVVHNLVQCRPLDLLPLQVGHGVHEVEADTTLSQLPDKEFLLLWAGDI